MRSSAGGSIYLTSYLNFLLMGIWKAKNINGLINLFKFLTVSKSFVLNGK